MLIIETNSTLIKEQDKINILVIKYIFSKGETQLGELYIDVGNNS